MVKTLKDIVNCYKNNLIETPNLHIIDQLFYNELITFLDT